MKKESNLRYMLSMYKWTLSVNSRAVFLGHHIKWPALEIGRAEETPPC